MYTTIIHPLRKAFNLSIREYCVLDSIHMLSNNDKFSGWCVASKETIAEELDISRRTVQTILNTLEQKELIKRDDTTGFVKSSDVWGEVIANKHDYFVAFKGKEIEFASGKNRLRDAEKDKQCAKVAQVVQKLPNGVQKLHKGCAKTSHNIYIDNNKINTTTVSPHIKTGIKREESEIPQEVKDSLYPIHMVSQGMDKPILKLKPKPKLKEISKEIEQAPVKKKYGNEDINKMLEALKGKVNVEAFVDSSIERNMAKHCVSLIGKIGKDEFVRRLDVLLADSFHAKNCNKIKYIYNNVKGFKDVKVDINKYVL